MSRRQHPTSPSASSDGDDFLDTLFATLPTTDLEVARSERDFLLTLFDDPDVSVRVAAAETIRDPLLHLLRVDPDGQVAAQSRADLRAVRERETNPEVISALNLTLLFAGEVALRPSSESFLSRLIDMAWPTIVCERAASIFRQVFELGRFAPAMTPVMMGHDVTLTSLSTIEGSWEVIILATDADSPVAFAWRPALESTGATMPALSGSEAFSARLYDPTADSEDPLVDVEGLTEGYWSPDVVLTSGRTYGIEIYLYLSSSDPVPASRVDVRFAGPSY